MPIYNAYSDPHNPGRIIEEIPAPPIQYLVFEGGGVRGSAYGGVVDELARIGVLASVQHVAGTSIGAIAAMLVALGYTPLEMNQILYSANFADFLEHSKPWPITPEFIITGKKYLSIFTGDGNSLSPGKLLNEWLEERVAKKLGSKFATFRDLTKLALSAQGKQAGFKQLHVHITNLSKTQAEMFNMLTKPDVPIALAVRMSATFPGVFGPLALCENINCGEKEHVHAASKVCTTDNVSKYGDGGITKNLAADYFNKREFLPEGYDFTDTGANPAVLAIKIDTTEEMGLLWNNMIPRSIKGFKDYGMALLDAVQSQHTDVYTQFSLNVIQVHDQDVDTLKFDLSRGEKKKLIASGFDATSEYWENHFAEAYEIKSYPNQAAWLGSKSLEDVNEIKLAYVTMRATQAQQGTSASSLKCLDDKITWFDDYLKARFAALLQPLTPLAIIYTPHIDLVGQRPRIAIDKVIKAELNAKFCSQEKEYNELQDLCHEIASHIDTSHETLHHVCYPDIVYLAKLEENLKRLRRELADKKTKLNKVHPSVGLNALADKVYADFYAALHELATASTPPTHSELITSVKAQLKAMHATFYSDLGNVIYLDLKQDDDFKLMIIALHLYLSYVNSFTLTKGCIDTLTKKVAAAYTELCGSADLPKNLAALGALLQKDKTDLLLAAFSIETLMKSFMTIDMPHEKSYVIDLDAALVAFGSSSFIKKKPMKSDVYKEDEKDCEMKVFYSSYTHSNKLLLFQRIDAEEELEESINYVESDSKDKRNQLPKATLVNIVTGK